MTSDPVRASHKRIESSAEALAIILPSLLREIEFTKRLCPFIFLISFPDYIFQIFIKLSFDPLIIS